MHRASKDKAHASPTSASGGEVGRCLAQGWIFRIRPEPARCSNVPHLNLKLNQHTEDQRQIRARSLQPVASYLVEVVATSTRSRHPMRLCLRISRKREPLLAMRAPCWWLAFVTGPFSAIPEGLGPLISQPCAQFRKPFCVSRCWTFLCDESGGVEQNVCVCWVGTNLAAALAIHIASQHRRTKRCDIYTNLEGSLPGSKHSPCAVIGTDPVLAQSTATTGSVPAP